MRYNNRATMDVNKKMIPYLALLANKQVTRGKMCFLCVECPDAMKMVEGNCICEQGYFVTTIANNIGCNSCPIGTKSEGRTCEDCPINTYSQDGSASCQPCPDKATSEKRSGSCGMLLSIATALHQATWLCQYIM